MAEHSPQIPATEKRATTTMGLGLLCEDYHKKNTGHESYNSIAREMSNNMTAGLVHKLSIQRFYIWHTEFTGKVNFPVNCLRSR